MNFINQMVIAKTHPSRPSRTPGTFYNEVELLDPNNEYKWYHTYIDEENTNYTQWKQLFDQDHKGMCYVANGMFRITGKGKNLINGDAKFTIDQGVKADELLPLIAQHLNLLETTSWKRLF